jgi:hypothetical protein
MNEKLKAKQSNIVLKQLNNGTIKTDVITFMSISCAIPKYEAREIVESIIKENHIEVKRVTKSGALREWFLAQDDTFAITKDMLKQKCEELDMKGGSVKYYIDSYMMAIEIAKKLKS